MGKINFSKGPSPLQRRAHLQMTHFRMTSLTAETLDYLRQAKLSSCSATRHYIKMNLIRTIIFSF